MPRFAANLSFMYTEHPFLERFAAAAKDGFHGVECLFPYEVPAAQFADILNQHRLHQVLFNAPAGNWQAGERGIAALPGREDEFKHSFDQALEYAKVLGNLRIHVMAGLVHHENELPKQRATYLKNLSYAALLAAREGITVTIEPINARDMPGYFLTRQDQAQEICAEVGVEYLKVQFDMYHAQITEGDLATKIIRDINRKHGGIGHFQIAGVPDRHEPDLGEVNYPYLFQLIDQLGYDGWISCEYHPLNGTSEGLGWLKPWLV
jgi:2-dehydrotetronate isomerase